MQIKINGNTYEVSSILGKQVYFQSANRQALEIQFKKDTVNFGELEKLTSDENNIGKITIIDGEKQYVHDNYSLRTELSIKPIVTESETSDTPEKTEDMICLTLAQLTYLELKVKQQEEKQAQSDQAIAELSALVAGGAE